MNVWPEKQPANAINNPASAIRDLDSTRLYREMLFRSIVEVECDKNIITFEPFITSMRDTRMPTYRRIKGHDTWHWCTNCRDWPTSNYDEVTLPDDKRPASGELDNECKAKE